VAHVVSGRPHGADVTVTGAAADSREVDAGDIFVAIGGARVDGHDFVGDAFERGAAGALVSRDGAAGGPTVWVEDTGAALLTLAADERGRMAGDVVGVTGSSGKTSVKDLAAAVLATRHRVHASPAPTTPRSGCR